MNARSLWKECVLQEAEFCKHIFKHILPVLVPSRASASPVEVGRIVHMSDMPGMSRNSQEYGEGKIWACFPSCVTTAGAWISSTATSPAGLATAVRLARRLASGSFRSPSRPSAQPAGSGNPKVLVAPSYELEGKRISSLCPQAIRPHLANAAGQDNPSGHCPYSFWLTTGNRLAPSALKRLANSRSY